MTSNSRHDDNTWKTVQQVCKHALTWGLRCAAPAGLISITHYVASELSAQLRHESPDRSQRAAHLYSWVVNSHHTSPPKYGKCRGADECTHIKYLSAWLNPEMEEEGVVWTWAFLSICLIFHLSLYPCLFKMLNNVLEDLRLVLVGFCSNLDFLFLFSPCPLSWCHYPANISWTYVTGGSFPKSLVLLKVPPY